MYGNKTRKKKSDGTQYKDYYFYGCKHHKKLRGNKCNYKRQIREELLDNAVVEVISKIVKNPKFVALMQEKINMKVDTSAVDNELANYEKQLKQYYLVKGKLTEEIDGLNPDDKHYSRMKLDLDNRLYTMYDNLEELVIETRAKKQALEVDKLTRDNIFKVLIYFDKLYALMNDEEKRKLVGILIDNVQIFEEKQENGQWLKSIEFKLPIIDGEIGLENGLQNETVCLLHRKTTSAF